MSQQGSSKLRIGVDLGGTKIAGVLLSPEGIVAEDRISAPRGDYPASVKAIADLVDRLRANTADPVSVGVGVPGSLSPNDWAFAKRQFDLAEWAPATAGPCRCARSTGPDRQRCELLCSV